MRKWVMLYPFISILILLWIEQGIEVTYIWKTLAKIILFVVVPLLYVKTIKSNFLKLQAVKKNQFIPAMILGGLVLVSILTAFLLFRDAIDLAALRLDLETRVGVTALVFPFVALYIMLGNSFLEEFFFRGLLVDLFPQSKWRWIMPSFLFAIYHVAIFLPWFEWPILLLAVAGLFIGGLLFQWMNKASGTIYSGWIIHISADIGVLLIGIYMFYFI
jgi:membrane protease YdiL (CAAX protease family)